MKLFYIYLGTVAFSTVVTLIKTQALDERMKREGYLRTDKYNSRTSIEKLSSAISAMFYMAIPFYNIANSIVLLCMPDDKLFEFNVKKLVDQGLCQYKPAFDITGENKTSKTISQMISDLDNDRTDELNKRLAPIRNEKTNLENLKGSVANGIFSNQNNQAQQDTISNRQLIRKPNNHNNQ